MVDLRQGKATAFPMPSAQLSGSLISWRRIASSPNRDFKPPARCRNEATIHPVLQRLISISWLINCKGYSNRRCLTQRWHSCGPCFMIALDPRRVTFERTYVMRFTSLFCESRYPETTAHFCAAGIKVREANQKSIAWQSGTHSA
ncbi:hypothetical protein MESS2_1120002 [Mesorhizobium metallidurans STM 2683]|uniref:Uncharacterized protein n=1 Tax=Mesorhizobium metallidurans STM 2683 TaxID=1297569 RepID=M5EHL1_9HYPH|nr:hypothetical protein MESS2_1120002 [Mesorhizobium metallidurans STM 2683]